MGVYRSRALDSGLPIDIAPSLIAFAGDSVTAATIEQNTALTIMNVQRGMQFWVPFLSKRRIRSRPDLNFGVSGNTSAALLARIDAVCNSDADVVVVQIGTNDLGFLTYDQSVANLEEIWSRLRKAHKIVIALPPLPRDLASSANRGQLLRLIRYVEEKRYAGVKNFTSIATAAAFIDPLSATCAPKVGYAYDGLHPVASGEYYTSLKIVEFLDHLLPPDAATFFSVADTISADNPTGNILLNGLMAGTGGSFGGLDGGASAGSVPDQFQFSYSDNGGDLGGLTTTLTPIVHPVDGRPGRRIRIQGTYSGAGSPSLNASSVGIFNQFFFSFGSFSAGDTLRGRMEISKAAAANERLTGLELHLYMVMNGATYRRADGSSLGEQLPKDAYSGVLETPPITLPAVPTAVQCGLRFYLQNAAQTIDSSVDCYGMELRKLL